MRRIQISAPEYPNPRTVARPWRYLLLASWVVGVPLLATHNPLGWLCMMSLILWMIVTARRARHMRDEALSTLEASAAAMSRDEVERRLGIILNVYGGKPLPSVRQRVARIRDRTVQ